METKNKVFNSFIYNVLMKNLDNIEQTDIYEPTNFDIWFCSKNKSFDNRITLTLKDLITMFPNSNKNKGDNFNINNISAIYLDNLGQTDIETVSDEDGLPSVSSYQSMLNIPASAYMFSKNNAPVDLSIRQDSNYNSFDYYVKDTINNIPIGAAALKRENDFNIEKLTDTTVDLDYWNNYCKEYFDSEYNFSAGYSDTEYNIFNVKKDLLVENMVNLHAIDSDIDILPTDYVGGALLITWYNGPRKELYNYQGKLYYKESLDNLFGEKNIDKSTIFMDPQYSLFPENYSDSIPVCYIELPKTYNLKDTKINIQWSENGIFSFK